MSKFEEFKEFCKTKPFLIEKIHKKETTWQELYEVYDIYGEDADVFKDEKKEEKEKEESEEKEEEETKEKKDSTNGILDLLGNFDPDKLADGLNGVKKILAVLGEVTKPEENEYVTKRKMTRPYQRSDD